MPKEALLCFARHCWPVLAGAFLSLSAWATPAAARDLSIVKPAVDCASLAETDVAAVGNPPARIVSAAVVNAPSGTPYCEVRGYVAPQVKFELRLPTQNWTQRLLYSGCGGFCGRVDFRIRAAEGCAAVENGELAVVASNLGHDTPDGNGDTVWAADNNQAKIDYGYRGVHVVAVTAKEIIQHFYGRAAAYAYFNGCSDGGREAMMEVQRYPLDFDGVVAGAAVIHNTVNNTVYHAWNTQHLERSDHSPIFSAANLTLLHQAALDACNGTPDGTKGSVIEDVAACRFDPAVASCARMQRDGCLSSEQLSAVRAIYAGPIDEAGRPLYFGMPIGSERAWSGPGLAVMARAFVRYMASNEVAPESSLNIRYDRASFDRYNLLGSIYNATDPNIAAFQGRGGKLIMWHGWADIAVPPMSTVEYYRAVKKHLGPAADNFLKVYMLPGVGHCGGGDGEDRINFLDPIMAWVEDGKAPDGMDATRKVFGRTISTRQIQPYRLPPGNP